MNPSDYAKSGTESSHQIALFMNCAYHLKKYPELKWFHAIPNGGLRDKITAAKLKAEGVKSGVSDCMLPVKRGPYCGLYLELKKLPGKGVGPSTEQLEFGEFVTSQGYYFAVCYGHEEAWSCLQWYLELDK
jgi:hypothetical protein